MSERYVPPTDWVREAAADKYANRVSRPAFNRWLAAHDREGKAEAWEEGKRAGHKALGGQFVWFAPENPYRIESEARP